MTSDAAVLARFDRQVRQGLSAPQPGWVVERVGRVVRVTAPQGLVHGCYVEWSDLDTGCADAEIAAQVAYFGGRGRRFEWKAYGYDGPPDLPERLLRAGFVADETEALVVGPVAVVTDACSRSPMPAGVRVRAIEVDDQAAWEGISRLHELVWERNCSEWVQALTGEVAADPTAITVLVAEAGTDAQVVCAGWVRFHAGTDFASLWGGSTAPAWRGRGIYRALVGERARVAAERGFELLQVDASQDSRPILQRLGLRVLTTTTPYIWTP